MIVPATSKQGVDSLICEIEYGAGLRRTVTDQGQFKTRQCLKELKEIAPVISNLQQPLLNLQPKTADQAKDVKRIEPATSAEVQLSSLSEHLRLGAPGTC